MFNIQEQEERDYNPQSDWQNAFDWSRMNRRPNDPRIAQELAKGRIVVVICSLEFCPSTDACMGEREDFHSAYFTHGFGRLNGGLGDARLHAGGGCPDCHATVRGLPVSHVTAEAACDESDIPF